MGGTLKASLSYAVDLASRTVAIGTNLFYALYVELGTGIFAEKGDGRKTPWVWWDQNGKFYFTRGMKPKPFPPAWGCGLFGLLILAHFDASRHI